MHLLSSHLHVLWAVNSAVGLLVAILGVGIIVNFQKLDFELLRARLFMGKTFYRMWVYSTIFGVSAILYGGLVTLNGAFHFDIDALVEMSRSLFVTSFLVLTYKWYNLIKLCYK